jgi:acetyl-CoA acetyltransferase
MSTKVVISEPLRTAIGTFGGALQDVSAVKLGITVVIFLVQDKAKILQGK